MVSTWARLVVSPGWVFSAAGSLVLRSRHVQELLDSFRHVAEFVAVVLFQLICHRLGGPDVLCRRGVDGALRPEHAGNGRATLPNRAEAVRPLRSRRAADSSVHLTSVGFREASHAGQSAGALDKLDAACLQHLGVYTFRDGR